MSETADNPNLENKCPQCGAPLPSGVLAGLCPACLLKQAATETATQSGIPKFQPPTVEELAKLFPQLEIISLLGRGGMGAVYKARQPLLDRIVALKILPAQVTLGTDFSDRFTREARALAKLNHPNIVMVHEFGQVNGQPYFIMEYVAGLNLRQLEQEGKLSPREALQIVPQICEALQFAHDAGIVHRDIKPDNILLDKKGRVKIADFGIAKILGTAEDAAVPVTQGAIGTPHYMAPEQVEKPQTVDHRADIFSLGVVFYEMLTGELPLGKFAPPSSSPRGVQVDVRLDEVVLRALERRPELRYQHASQVKTAVETIAGTHSSGAAGALPAGHAIPENLLARDYQLQIRHCLQRGWALVKSDFWPLVGMTTLILALIAVVDSAFPSSHHDGSGIATEGLSFLALLLNGPLLAGLCFYFVKKIRHEPATAETAFAGFLSKRFLHLFLANFVTSSLVALGFLFFILPGVYLLVAWIFTLALVIDKGLDFWPAMELSRKLVHKHWWKVLLFLLTVAGLLLGGLICCGVGLFLAAPLAIAAFMYAYEDIFGAQTSARPAADNTIRVTPPPVGPAGTMVMPNAGGTPPPKAGTPPPPIAGTTPSPSGGENREPVKPARSPFFPVMIILLFVVALLVAVGIALAVAKKEWNKTHAPRISVTLPAVPAAPLPPSVSRPAAEPVPAGGVAATFDNPLTKHIRLELEKISIGFDQLQVASSSDSNLVVNFIGLRQVSSAATNSPAPGGILVSNEDAVVSISPENGIQVQDKKGGKHASVSLPFIHINVDVDQAKPGSAIEGNLTGTRVDESLWEFTGSGKLSPVRFAMTNLDLKAVLAPPAMSANLHEKLSDRLAAAETITDPELKDKSLTSLAKDAATAGEIEIMNSALRQMIEMDQRDEVMRDAALLLAKAGHVRQAIETAKGISDPDLRDKALSELAQ